MVSIEFMALKQSSEFTGMREILEKTSISVSFITNLKFFMIHKYCLHKLFSVNNGSITLGKHRENTYQYLGKALEYWIFNKYIKS